MKNIVIFGAPGSGKGTQSGMLAERYGLRHISTGDVLRGEIKNKTELGRTAERYISEGRLLPDSLMTGILASVYDSACPCEGVIFDGFPRTTAQAESLDEMLRGRGAEVKAMIELDVPDDVLISRMLLRGKTSGRADDNEETIRKRLAVYKSQTAPLIEWYEARGKRRRVNGVGGIESIFSDICRIIDGI